jgi:hypothetical protein
MAGLGHGARNENNKQSHVMKNLMKTLAVAAAVLALSTSAFAGDCCTKAAKAAKEGKTCEKCEKDACCKKAVKDLGKAAKACEKCAKKS